MSTRILALLATAASALALAGGITAANASPAAPPPAPEPSVPAPPPVATSPPSPASPSGTPTPGKEPATEDEGVKANAALEECRDADCEIEIKDSQMINLDKGYGAESIGVEVEGTRVTFTIRNGKSRAVTSMQPYGRGTTANYNGLTLRPHMSKDGKLMLTVSHS